MAFKTLNIRQWRTVLPENGKQRNEPRVSWPESLGCRRTETENWDRELRILADSLNKWDSWKCGETTTAWVHGQSADNSALHRERIQKIWRGCSVEKTSRGQETKERLTTQNCIKSLFRDLTDREASPEWLKTIELHTQKGWDLLYKVKGPILIQVAYSHVESAF